MTDQTKFRLNEINKIKDYFNSEINQKKSCSKKLSNYIPAFDYIDKVLNGFFFATSRVVCIISSVSVVGVPVRIADASFTLTTEVIKKLLSITRNKKKKHDTILMLAKSKLNRIETLVSQALDDMEISHEQFIRILNEKDKYEKMKENLRNVNEKLKEKTENKRLNSVNSRT